MIVLSSPAEIKKKLEENWIRFIKANSAKLSLGTIDGSSPPSIFVGRYGYPKVRIGPMIPPLHGIPLYWTELSCGQVKALKR